MKDYTIGFMFSEDGNEVLLILKDRPEWQKGKLNGIGGKWEPKDGTSDNSITQVREFKEETGIDTTSKDWEPFAVIEGIESEKKTGTEIGSGYRIWAYRAFSNEIYNAKQMESEIPTIVHVLDVPLRLTTSNVSWLVQMALTTESGTILNIKYE